MRACKGSQVLSVCQDDIYQIGHEEVYSRLSVDVLAKRLKESAKEVVRDFLLEFWATM